MVLAIDHGCVPVPVKAKANPVWICSSIRGQALAGLPDRQGMLSWHCTIKNDVASLTASCPVHGLAWWDALRNTGGCVQVLNLQPALAVGLILVSCCPGGQVRGLIEPLVLCYNAHLPQ